MRVAFRNIKVRDLERTESRTLNAICQIGLCREWTGQ